MIFTETLIRASCMGYLFTEPREVAAKKAGELSATAKGHLIKIYIEEYWGRKKDVQTKQMSKGTNAEEEVIALLTYVDEVKYLKNNLRYSNEWATGHADIVLEDEIIDVKASWEPETFMPKILEPLDKTYNIQLQTYMWLYGKPKARLVYGLVNTPDFLLKNELQRLLYSMDVISDMSPEYIKAAKDLTKNHVFNDIPPEERIISIEVPRNEEIIDQMPGKVEKARKYLAEIHEKHLNLSSKHLSIDSVDEINT